MHALRTYVGIPESEDVGMAGPVTDAVVVKNLQGIVTHWNAGAEELFGYTASEMLGEPIFKLLPDDRLMEEQDNLARLLSRQHVENLRTVRVTKQGERIPVLLMVTPLRDARDIIVGASETICSLRSLRPSQDVLEAQVKALEERLQEKTERLANLASELELFSYTLAHDVRAPLRSIQSFTELVLDECGADLGDNKALLQRVISAVGRLDHLILNTVSLAQSVFCKQTLTPLDVRSLIHRVISERRDLNLPGTIIKVENTFPSVLGHEASFTCCLNHLLNNALKFTILNGLPDIYIFSELGETGVRICVQDHGVGLDVATQERLRCDLQRCQNISDNPGIGVGLISARKSAERMEGQIGFRSAPGDGTTFWVELRAAP